MPKFRWTVWAMMVGVAAVGVGLFLLREFDEGLPPRFVIRGIPSRVQGLRPGMTMAQTREALGLGKSWVRGGIGSPPGEMTSGAYMTHASYHLRPQKLDAAGKFYRSSAMISLQFRHRKPPPWFNDDSAELVRASFSNNGRIIAEVPAKGK